MKIPNYDCGQDETNYQQLHDFMPYDNFRMLICGPNGCGKTNTLMYMMTCCIMIKSIFMQRI